MDTSLVEEATDLEQEVDQPVKVDVTKIEGIRVTNIPIWHE